MIKAIIATALLLAASASADVISCFESGAAGVPADLPGEWGNFGCWLDAPSSLQDRFLSGASYSDSEGMTVESCINFCISQNFDYAGLEYGGECYCDYAIGHNEFSVEDCSGCNMPCTGNANEFCGGPGRVNLYENFAVIPPPLTPVPAPSGGGWPYVGCYNDNTSARTLERRVNAQNENVTATSCVADCINSGFTIAGLEYGQECWCGNSIENGATNGGGDCTMTCNQDRYVRCGGPGALDVYSASL